MKNLFFLAATAFALTFMSCNNNETESEEMIVKDSMGVTMPPVTDRVDSTAADTLSTATPSPEEATSSEEEVPAGVQSTTENFVSADGQSVKAVYNNNGQMSVATLTINGEEIKLMQTEAWAKGAEYSNGKIKWRAEGDNATLTKDGKATKFSLKK